MLKGGVWLKSELASFIKELPKNEFYRLPRDERVKRLEEIWKEIDETSLCNSEELMEELWKIRGKVLE